MAVIQRARFPIVAIVLLALLAALWGALLRLSWNLPPLIVGLPTVHGPLIISGFLGTLISLERAVALRARWPYAAPLLSAMGALLLLSGISPMAGAVLIVLGSLGMIAIFVVIVRRQPALFTFAMALGAVAWCVGNLIWLADVPVFRLVQWWMAFLVLTIVGERLELSRLLRLTCLTERLYLAAIVSLLIGLIVDSIEGIVFPAYHSTIGMRIIGAAILGLALWLLRYDIARRTVQQNGLTRFIAWCLLLGYVWLGIGGLLRLINPDLNSTLMYDAMLHTVFLGFVMSMIFGHAPIILPAVLGRSMSYHSAFYAHLILLHLSLAVRIAADLFAGTLAFSVWQWGGTFNVIAVLLFLFAAALSILSG